MKILLVEDSPFQAKFVRRQLLDLLQDFESSVTITETLAETIKQLQKTEYDILLLDLDLPDSTKLNTFYKINESQTKVPVIILTSAEDEEMALKAIKAGAQDYLYKTELSSGMLIRSIMFAIERNRRLHLYKENHVNCMTDREKKFPPESSLKK